MLASSTTFINKSAATVRRTRVNSNMFWLLFAIEGLVVASVCVFVLYLLLPATTPLSTSGDVSIVREAIFSRLSGTVADPLIEVTPRIVAHSSNLRGFTHNGVVYYYYIEGKQNFDPFSRGEVSQNQIEVVLRDTNGPTPLVIYRYK